MVNTDNADVWASEPKAPGVPIEIPFPGAAEPVTLHGAEGLAPTIQVGGGRPKVRIFSGLQVPMVDGSVEYIKMFPYPPGFPIVKHRGNVIYKYPQSQRPDKILTVLVVIPPLLTFKVWLAFLLGAVGMYLAAWWLKSGPGTVLARRVVVAAVIVAEVVVSVMIWVAVIQWIREG